MLAQRLRRWPSNKTSLFQHVGLLGVYCVCMFLSFLVCVYYYSYTLWRAAAVLFLSRRLPVHINASYTALSADHFEYKNMSVVLKLTLLMPYPATYVKSLKLFFFFF